MRSPDPRAEFIEDDGHGVSWDVKSFRSDIQGPGAFDLEASLVNMNKKLSNGINIIVNTAHLDPADLATLRRAIEERGWISRVLYEDGSLRPLP